jgi:D-alanyl-D-alanine carboxypeptidase
MVNTRYANASGLPASGQYTTARDTAILAHALLIEYPERSTLFSERRTRAGGRGIATTNPLFGRVPGAQGMKTGFTCAAGYNIAGLVERDGRRVLAVTLGHRRKAARLAAVRTLIDDGFDRLGEGRALAPGTRNPATPPDIASCKGGQAVAKAAPKVPDTYIPPPRPASPPPRVFAVPKPVPVVPPRVARKPPPPPPLSGWAVSLGAFDSDRAAATRLKAINMLATRTTTLPSKILPRPRDNRHLGIIYGLDRAQARALCGLAKGIGQYCLTLAPQTLLNPKARWRR